MATVNLTTAPTQVDDGSSYTVLVTNTGAVEVDLSRGGRLRPGQSRTVYPEGVALTAASTSGAGQVSTVATGKPLPNPSDPTALAANPAFTGTYALRRRRPILPVALPESILAVSPPTLTQSAAGAATTITSSVDVAPMDSRLTHLGSKGAAIGSVTFPYSNYVYSNNVYPNPTLPTTGNPVSSNATAYNRVAFGFDGAKFEVKFLGLYATGTIQVRVNGKRAVLNPIITGVATGNVYRLLVDFTTAANRQVEVEMAYAPFGGLTIGPTDNIIPALPGGPKAVWVGDSYVSGAGPVSFSSGFATTASDILGWDYTPSGLGGTGYLATGTTVTFRSRVANDVIALAPEIIVWAGGHNDTGSSAAAIQAEATLLYAQAKAALPNTAQIALGPLPSQVSDAVNSGYVNVRNGLQAAATAAGIIFVDTLTVPIFPGANAAAYVQGDSVHPTQAGANYLGWQVASRIAAAVSAQI